MAAFTSTQAGDWSDQATWGASGPPTDGDSATVNHAVTVDANTTVGTSGVAGTVDVTVDATGGNTGALTIATGVTLTVKGDLQLKNAVLTLSAGSHYRFGDGGSAQIYKIQISSTTGQTLSKLVCNGTGGSRCTIGKSGSAGNGLIGRGTSSGSTLTNYDCHYTDFSNLGGTTTGFGIDAIEMFANNAACSVLFDNCTFDSCGRIFLGSMNVATDFTFTHNRVTNPINSSKFMVWFSGLAASVGDRIITDNVFVHLDYQTVFSGNLTAWVIERNVFSRTVFSGIVGSTPASIEHNLLYIRTGASSSNLGAPGLSSLNNYAHADMAVTTVCLGDHSFTSTSGTITHDGWIFDGSYQNEDTDCYQLGAFGLATTVNLVRCLIIPNSRGLMSGAFTAHGGPNCTVNVNHCTFMSSQTGGAGTGDAAVYIGSGYASHTGMYPSIQSNLCWNKTTPASEGWLAFKDSATADNPDIVTDLDYNATFNLRDGTIFDESGANDLVIRGYNRFFMTDHDTTVGTNDITLSGSDETTGGPKFVDSSRNMATFDTAFLGNSATAWADATVYAVGDIVSASDSGFYGGATINYRCVLAHTSATGHATNGKPGVAASYRTNWEFASAYRIREAVIAGTLTSGKNYIEALGDWVKEGFAPSEVTLANAGHDGVTIGAVETAANPLVAGTIAFVSSGPAVINLAETASPTGGDGTIVKQWQRNEDGGAFSDLVGETADTLADTDVTDGILYGYRIHYTDEGSGDEVSNSVTAEVYSGGVIGEGGGGSIFDSAVIR